MKKKAPGKKSSATRKKKRHVRKPHPNPTIHIVVSDCFVTETRVHAPAKKNGGYVTFNTDDDCTLDFDDISIFDRLSLPGTPGSLALSAGNTKMKIQVDAGTFSYEIEGCNERRRSVGAAYALDASDPKDIIVP